MAFSRARWATNALLLTSSVEIIAIPSAVVTLNGLITANLAAKRTVTPLDAGLAVSFQRSAVSFFLPVFNHLRF